LIRQNPLMLWLTKLAPTASGLPAIACRGSADLHPVAAEAKFSGNAHGLAVAVHEHAAGRLVLASFSIALVLGWLKLRNSFRCGHLAVDASTVDGT
jgi:hypothetical protein